MKKTILLLAVLLRAVLMSAQGVIDLSGEWQFMTDRNDVGEKEEWYRPDFRFDDSIKLPGSMPQRMKGDDVTVATQWIGALYDSSYYFNPYMEKYRVAAAGSKIKGSARPGEMKLPFFLTPVKHYVGKAWYRRTVTLTEQQARALNELYLERPHIISKVWVNGEPFSAGAINTLSIPHVHRRMAGAPLKAGENTIVICIDNDPVKVNVGNDSHSVTDQTQGCWNGIVGRMELRAASHVGAFDVYPDVDARQVKVRMALSTAEEKGEKVTVTLVAESFNTAKRHIVTSKPMTLTLVAGQEQMQEAVLDMGDEMLLWDEFCPQLYRLTAEVKTAQGVDYRETYFGMRKIEIKDKMFYVNGRQIQLRGNVDNCLFPDTGYPPTDLDTWVRLMEKQKAWGINHIRFHSYCPPENAFLAADIVGMYIQPEGPSWPNHGVKLGRGEYIDTYLYDEAVRICDVYGNHPSFTFFAFGNEPAGNWVKWCSDKVPQIKEYDGRHIYAGFSVGGGWAWQPKSEFAVKAGARGLAEWVRSAPESMVNFAEKITTYNGKDMPNTPITVPFVTHEMGQWCVFPNFEETAKYKGVNKALNFDIFRDILKDNGMESRGRDFLMASGKLQTLCYKYETERILRTPGYAGFQMLSLNDYSGQGSALVGVTDVFFDEKGYVTAPEFREFCSPVVPLAEFKKFTYSNTETFEADITLNQFAEGELKGITPHWTLLKASEKQGEIMLMNMEAPVAEGDLARLDLPVGQNIKLGHVSIPLSGITRPTKVTLYVSLPGVKRYGQPKGSSYDVQNHWDFWVYPEQQAAPQMKIKAGKRKGTAFYGDVYVTDSLDDQARKLLKKKNGKVLICAAGKTTYGKEVVQQFLPVFWNTSWFKMRPPHTTGLYIEQAHPVFSQFPTDYHSDLQWWELVNRARVMQFTDFPQDFQPIVQSIDTWFVSRKIGMLFEANVGKGRLMMTTMDITNNLDKRIVAKQMRDCIINYMTADSNFHPQWTIDMERISDLFTKVAGEVNMFTNDSPDELKPSLDNSIKK